MYFFVRYTGYVMVIFGVFFLLAGLALAVYGIVQHQALLQAINASLQASNSPWRVQDVRFLTSISGLFVFLTGMFVSALGQLLLIFADLANYARETNILLRSMRWRPSSLPRSSEVEPDQPVG